MNNSRIRSRSGAIPALRSVSSTMGEMIVTGCALLIRASLYLLECILMSFSDGIECGCYTKKYRGVQPKILTETFIPRASRAGLPSKEASYAPLERVDPSTPGPALPSPSGHPWQQSRHLQSDRKSVV